MKLYKSKITGREFYVVDEVPPYVVNGIPCFLLKELDEMKGKNYSASEVNLIFDLRMEAEPSVESEESKTSVREEIGYVAKKKEPESIYASARAKEAEEKCRSIKETIISTRLRGIKE